MKTQRFFIALIISLCASGAFSRNVVLAQTVTLHPARDKATGKYDEGKACFDFKSGGLRNGAKGRWDLGYGFASINGEDWFILSGSNEVRSVIKDIGEFNWNDSFKVPALKPLPELPKGEPRQVVVDASADTGKAWERTTNIMAKVITGHIYLMRIKDEESDFYVLFRVEDFKQDEFCAITWKFTQTSDQ
ncbi:MAG TPA: hypothetical protein VJZ26_12545 [Blastocatellia bacterium]|nr:hypothetical protein [Blastocatellia bacterium]